MHRLWVLQLECDSIAVQLVRQALFVGRFEQSRAQMTVNLNGAANHTIGKIVEFPLRARRALRGEADLLKNLAMPTKFTGRRRSTLNSKIDVTRRSGATNCYALFRTSVDLRETPSNRVSVTECEKRSVCKRQFRG